MSAEKMDHHSEWFNARDLARVGRRQRAHWRGAH